MGTGRIPGPLRKTYGTCWTPVFRSLFPPGINNLLFNSDDCRLILILRIDKIIEKHSHLEFFVENLCVFEQKLGPSHQVFTWFNFNNDWFNFIISHWQCLVENPIEFLMSETEGGFDWYQNALEGKALSGRS